MYKTFLDKSFSILVTKKVEHLIIDLRGNSGGDPYCGSYLLEYIAKKVYLL